MSTFEVNMPKVYPYIVSERLIRLLMSMLFPFCEGPIKSSYGYRHGHYLDGSIARLIIPNDR